MKKSVKKQMKQWRRPLKRKGLTHTARKMKEGDPDAFRKGKSFLEMEENIESDEYWNAYDPHNDYYDYWDYREPYDENVEHFNLHHRLLETIIQLLESQFIELESVKNKIKPKKENYKENLSNNYLLLEKSLYEHIKMLQCIQTEEIADTASYLREAAGARENIEAVLEFANRIGNIEVARAIMVFSPFWVRSPHSWKGSDNISFIKHVFTQFDVPAYLIHEWLRDNESLRFKWLSWLIILGQGGSLKNLAPFFQWDISPKFQFHLQNLPSNLSPLEACVFAEVKRLGGNDTDAIRILRSRAFVIDPTENLDENYFKFWQDTVRWLIRHRNVILDEEADIILDWAMHQYTESERAIREEEYNCEAARQMNGEQIQQNEQQLELNHLQLFSMKGRSVQRVLEQSNEYLRQRSLPWSKYSWKNHGWDFAFDDPAYSGWEIVELTNGKELFLEGKDLGHCVSGYAGRCIANASAIFSLRQNGKRMVTIEIQPSTKQIIQARGQRNRSADKKENEIIGKWVNEVLRK